MANTGLWGPYSLTEANVDAVVDRQRIGAYALGTAQNQELLASVLRIGRSDDDVNKRLKTYVGKYSDFKFMYCDTMRQAFEKECHLWHEFKPKNNPNHPDKPTGTGYPCPVTGCPR